MTTRYARPADARAIAAIHVRAWQSAYRGIVPSSVLDELSVDQREAFWRQRLEEGGNITLLIAEENGHTLGWAAVGPSRDADAGPTTGELYALYVAPEHWRQGTGLSLHRAGVEHLRGAGFTELSLWVLADNTRARAFYGSAGFSIDAGIQKTLWLGGAELAEIRLRCQIGDGQDAH